MISIVAGDLTGGYLVLVLIACDLIEIAVTRDWRTLGATDKIISFALLAHFAAVCYSAAGLGGGLLAALVAFAPSFLFIIFGSRYFDRLRTNTTIRAFLTGAGVSSVLSPAQPSR